MDNSSILKLFLRFAKPYLPLAIISIMLAFVVVILNGATLWFSSSLVNTIFSSNIPDTTPVNFSLSTINAFLKYHTWRFLQAGTDKTMVAVLKRIALLLPILFLLKNITLVLQKALISLFNLKVIQEMRASFYEHVLHLPLHYYDKHRSGDVTAYIVNDLSQINGTMTDALNKLTVEPLTVIVFVGLLFSINVKLTLIILSIYPFIGFVITRIGKVMKRQSRKMLHSFSGIVSIISETVNGIRVVKMFNGARYEMNSFNRENETFTKRSFKAALVGNMTSPFTEIISMTMTSILLWYAGSQILDGSSSFDSDDFIKFLLILFSVYSPIKRLLTVYGTIQLGKAASERVFKVLNHPIEPIHKNQIPPPSALKKGVEARNISFTYPDFNDQVLNNISFDIPQGKITALIGSSGSGKSTILDLLPRFYEITCGEILIDDKNIAEMDLQTLRSYFGIVSQDTILFNDTIVANIAYAEEQPNKERVIESLKAANALEFIEKMEYGLNTVVGERGVMLSGGQKQRLAIARALYKNPAILILDEATSSLDTESEKSVQKAIDNLIKDRTTIVVAHRLSTIQNADTILVLESGKIVEHGNHTELLAQGGRYKEPYEIQFGNQENR